MFSNDDSDRRAAGGAGKTRVSPGHMGRLEGVVPVGWTGQQGAGRHKPEGAAGIRTAEERIAY